MQDVVENQESPAPEPLDIDSALNALENGDRDLVVLRFFEKRDLRWIGAALGVSEDAAQKRVSRVLEKLRVILAAQGRPISVAALTAGLATQVKSAPSGLAGAISTSALSSTGSGVATVASARQAAGFLTSHWAAMSVTLLLLGVPLLLERRAAARLRAENVALRGQIAELDRLRDGDRNKSRVESGADRADRNELLRLRAEVTQLHKEARERAALLAKAPPESEKAASDLAKPWPQITITTRIVEIPSQSFADFGKYGFPASLANGGQTTLSFTRESASNLVHELQSKPGVDLLSAPRLTTLSGREARIAVTDSVTLANAANPTGQRFEIGQIIDVRPLLQENGGEYSVSLLFSAAFTQLLSNETQNAGNDAGLPNPTEPRVRTRKAEGEVAPRNRETLAQAIPYWSESKKESVLLLLMTPLLVDTAGNAIR